MNINFDELEKFCTTKKQIKGVQKLKKKFSISNTADKQVLQNLVYSFFVHNQYEPIFLISSYLLAVKFEGNFTKWSGIENLLGILYASKVLDIYQKNIIFSSLESIVNYPYKDKVAQKINSTYLQDKLDLCAVKKYLDEIQKSIEDNDAAYEYSMRLGLISAAAIVQAINRDENMKLNSEMDSLIDEQKKFLNEERLLKYS